MPAPLNAPKVAVTPAPLSWDLPELVESGDVLFHDNKVQCFSPADAAFSGTATYIAAADGDASVANNQFSCEIRGPRMAVNVHAAAATVRMQGNRFAENFSQNPATEVSERRMISAITHGLLLNNTTNNQANHCIHATSARPNRIIQANNQVLVEVVLGITTCSREIKGRVLLDGKPVNGAIVSAHGADAKAITDGDGGFRISVPQNAVELTVAYGKQLHETVIVPAETRTVEIPLSKGQES